MREPGADLDTIVFGAHPIPPPTPAHQLHAHHYETNTAGDLQCGCGHTIKIVNPKPARGRISRLLGRTTR